MTHPLKGSCVEGCPLWGLCHCGCGGVPSNAVANHAQMGTKKGNPRVYLRGHNKVIRTAKVGMWGRNGIPVEKVRPLILWLFKRYGRKRAAEVVGIPEGTIEGYLKPGRKNADPQNVARIRDVVLAHRTPPDPYAEYGERRLPTLEERREAARNTIRRERMFYRKGGANYRTAFSRPIGENR